MVYVVMVKGRTNLDPSCSVVNIVFCFYLLFLAFEGAFGPKKEESGPGAFGPKEEEAGPGWLAVVLRAIHLVTANITTLSNILNWLSCMNI